MPIFYFHPENSVSKKLIEIAGCRGFQYINRGELEFKLQNLVAQAGFNLWPQFHTVFGPLGPKIEHVIALNPDDELDRITIKVTQTSKTPWSYVKLNNGPEISQCIGYCSTPSSNPFNMSATQMAQKGIIGVTHMPTVNS